MQVKNKAQVLTIGKEKLTRAMGFIHKSGSNLSRVKNITKKTVQYAVIVAVFSVLMNSFTASKVYAGNAEACNAFTAGLKTDYASWNNAIDTLAPLGNALLEDFESETADTPIDGSVFTGFNLSTSGDSSDDWDGMEFGTSPLSGNIQGTVRHRDLTTITFTATTPVIGFGINIGDMHDIEVGDDTNMKIKFGGTVVWDATAAIGGNLTGAATNTIGGEVVTVGEDTYTFFGYYDAQNPASTIEVEYSLRNKDNWTFDDVSLIFADQDEQCSSDIQLNKSSEFNDENNDGFAQAGETVSYSFTVTNTGGITLTDVTVTDPLIEVMGGPIASMSPGGTDSTTFTGTYTLLQADIDRGYIQNSAIATGVPSDSNGDPISGLDQVEDISDSSNPGGDEATETLGGDGNSDSDPTNDPTIEYLTPPPDIVDPQIPVDPISPPTDHCSSDSSTGGIGCIEELAETGARANISILVGSALLIIAALTSVQYKET